MYKLFRLGMSSVHINQNELSRYGKILGLTFLYFSAFGFCQELQNLLNVSYGPDPFQKMDIYLPEGRNTSFTKSIVLVHGGAWSGGNKKSMNRLVFVFYAQKYAVFNMNYRLGSIASPGFPKQIQDIDLALKFIQSKAGEYLINPTFGLMGVSAGAHLSMIYGYAGYNGSKEVEVKVICNLVGPASLVDPNYTNNSVYNSLILPLLGNVSFAQNPSVFYFASPIAYVNAQSPKTISFYGDPDPLIPKTQGEILEDKLDSVGVYNKFYLYPGGGHGNFTGKQYAHMYKKMFYFFSNYM